HAPRRPSGAGHAGHPSDDGERRRRRDCPALRVHLRLGPPLPRRHGALLLLSLGAGPPPPETGPARISGRRAWLWATRDPWPAAWGLLHLRYESAQPNKRLKLAGAYRFKGNGALFPGGHGLSSTTLAPAGGSPAAEPRSLGRHLLFLVNTVQAR